MSNMYKILAITFLASGDHPTGCVTADNIRPENNVEQFVDVCWMDSIRLGLTLISCVFIVGIVVGHAKVCSSWGGSPSLLCTHLFMYIWKKEENLQSTLRSKWRWWLMDNLVIFSRAISLQFLFFCLRTHWQRLTVTGFFLSRHKPIINGELCLDKFIHSFIWFN